MQTIPDQIAQARVAFAEAPDERARMGRISGVLWMFSAAVGMVDVFVPGSHHDSTPIVLAVGVLIFAYGLGSVTGWIPWEKATMDQLGIGMALTIPVAGLAIYLTGGSLSYIEPLLVCAAPLRRLLLPRALGLAAVDRADRGRRRAADLRPGRDRQRLPAPLPRPRGRLPRRDLGDGRAEEAPGRRRAAPARLRQLRPLDRGRQPPLLRHDDEAGARTAHATVRQARRSTPARWRC